MTLGELAKLPTSLLNLFMPVVIRKPKLNWIYYLHSENL